MDIQPAELQQRIDNNEDIVLIDVREDWEYDERNLNGKNIPLADLPARVSELQQWKDQEVIVHCKAGGRSAQAKMFLESQGFTNVRNLLGGIQAM
ncbi:MAG: rhodanese-like domain-containing protein [Cyclobacteriaceae bacterium]|nr:rhodanese-like domain-containing protein [Cyclobacteriaceae bacterium HetDA_MAG_MS6]